MGEDTLKLFRVHLKGLHGTSIDTDYGTSYVVSKDPTSAYLQVRDFLDKAKLGFDRERVLDRIELIADNCRYPPCRTLLFLPAGEM